MILKRCGKQEMACSHALAEVKMYTALSARARATGKNPLPSTSILRERQSVG